MKDNKPRKIEQSENGGKTRTYKQNRESPKNTGVANGVDLNEMHKLIIDEWFNNGYNKSRAVMEINKDVKNQSGAVHIFNSIVSSPMAKKYINALQSRLRGSNHITREQVAQQLTQWAFADATEVLGDTPEEREIKALPSHIRASIQSVKVTTRTETNRQGNEVSTKSVDFKLINKLDALDKYAKIIGAYELDNMQKTKQLDVTNWEVQDQLTLLKLLTKKPSQEDSNTIDITP